MVDYAEPVKAKGFVVMDTPGYDPVSMTGIVAGGANVLVFTTGRGSVFGCKPAPSIKVATNTPMYEHMIDDMDINAGVILDGTPVEDVGRQIFEEILAVASGKKTKSELNGVGEEEFAPWASGRRCETRINHKAQRHREDRKIIREDRRHICQLAYLFVFSLCLCASVVRLIHQGGAMKLKQLLIVGVLAAGLVGAACLSKEGDTAGVRMSDSRRQTGQQLQRRPEEQGAVRLRRQGADQLELRPASGQVRRIRRARDFVSSR